MTANQIFVTLSLLSIILGAVLFVAGLLVLIIRAVRKKKKRGTAILLILSVVLLAGGIFSYFKSTKLLVEEYQGGKNEQVAQKAEKTGDGTYCYRLSEFSYTDDNGNTFDNSTLAQYKYTVINHWEPWCVPCKTELPDMEKLYEEYRDKGINFVGIYTTEDDAKTVIAENGMTYPTVLYNSGDDGGFNLIHTANVPITCVVDSEGRLVRLGLSEQELSVYTDSTSDEMIIAFYDCLVAGTRTYEYWAEKLDALLG